MKKIIKITLICTLALSLLAFAASCAKKLPVPANVNINIDDEMTWDAIAGARNYSVEIINGATGELVSQNSPKNNLFDLSGLDEGSYKVRVKANGREGTSKDSDWTEYYDFDQAYDNHCVYTLINGGTAYEVTKAGKAAGDIIIEGEYRGRPVVSIAEAAFKSRNNITSVVIGENIKSIGKNAFYNCSKLTSITLPNSLQEIGVSAFQSSAIKSITIPGGVQIINQSAFSICRNLEEVKLEEGVEYIYDEAFWNTGSLKAIELPSSLIYIGESAFSSDNALTSIKFGSKLRYIGKQAFFGCSALDSIEFEPTENSLQIDEEAFKNCTCLEKIDLPEGLVTISDSAFFGSTLLKDVSLPSTLRSLGYRAFSFTEAVTGQYVPETYDIEDAFDYFVYLDGWVLDYRKNYAGSEYEKLRLSADEFEEGVVGIADYAFNHCRVEEIFLPASVKYIGEGAFGASQNLWRFEVPNNSELTVIGYRAFYNCPVLRKLNLGNKLERIEAQAFAKCSQIDNNVYGGSFIPESVTSIGQYAFSDTALWVNPDEFGVIYAGNWIVGCDSTTDQTISIKYDPDEGTLIGIADYAFYNNSRLRSVSGMRYVNYIGTGAFCGCSGLTSISFGSDLQAISDYAFYQCSSLYRVGSMPYELSEIGRSAFYECVTLEEIDFSANRNLKTISPFAFFGCTNLKKVVLPENLETIGRCAFYNCTSLGEISIPDKVTEIGDKVFYKCTSATTLNIGAGLEEIPEYTFANCTSLKSIEIPGTVKKIDSKAFYKCTDAKTIILNEGVEYVSSYAFYNNSNVEYVYLPTTLNTVEKYAFKGLDKLESIIIPASLENIESYAFYSSSKIITFYTDAESDLSTWANNWNALRRPVFWDCELSEDKTYVVSYTVKQNGVSNVNAKNGISDPVRDGYDFVGWATDKDAQTAEINSDQLGKINRMNTYYTVWEEKVGEPEPSTEPKPEGGTEGQPSTGD